MSEARRIGTLSNIQKKQVKAKLCTTAQNISNAFQFVVL